MRNQFDIEIQKLCGSCAKRTILQTGRVCSLTGETVECGGLCEGWEMHPKLQNAGRGGGRVKSLKYLNYYRERWLKQQEDLMTKRITADDFASAEDIRKDYEQEHGSIYINF